MNKEFPLLLIELVQRSYKWVTYAHSHRKIRIITLLPDQILLFTNVEYGTVVLSPIPIISALKHTY